MPPQQRIFTSSWRTPLDPSRFARIGISRGMPRRDRGFRRFRALEPGSWFKTASTEQYVRLYTGHLTNLDAAQVVRELEEMAGGLIPVLLCFEPPEPGTRWCHRGLVAKWLAEELALEVYEFGQEHEGFGAAHPKLPDGYRMVGLE